MKLEEELYKIFYRGVNVCLTHSSKNRDCSKCPFVGTGPEAEALIDLRKEKLH